MVHGRRARHVANVETAVTEPSTQVSVFPIQKKALIETASRDERVSPTSMHAPDNQSTTTLEAPVRTASSTTTLRRATARNGQGAKRARTTEKPRQHVRITACASCTLPSGSRIRGPTTAQDGSASSTDRNVDSAPEINRQSGLISSSSVAAGGLIDRPAESNVCWVANQRGCGNVSTTAALSSLEALSTTTASHGTLAQSR